MDVVKNPTIHWAKQAGGIPIPAPGNRWHKTTTAGKESLITVSLKALRIKNFLAWEYLRKELQPLALRKGILANPTTGILANPTTRLLAIGEFWRIPLQDFWLQGNSGESHYKNSGESH